MNQNSLGQSQTSMQHQSSTGMLSQTSSTSTISPSTISTNTQNSSGPQASGNVIKSAGGANDVPTQILTKPRLQELVRDIDPTEQLDEEVEELLLQLADDFVESAVNDACLLAKHRRANTVEVKDVQLYLERIWNMWIPGFGTDELRPYKRATVTEAHKHRMALIRKALKKY